MNKRLISICTWMISGLMLCSSVSAQEQVSLPIGEDEYLVIAAGEGTNTRLGGDQVLILDPQGNLVEKIESSGIFWNGKSVSDVMLIKENTPLVVWKPAEGDTILKGIYEVGKGWILEPQAGEVKMLSNEVYTDRTEDVTSGRLVRTDGKQISNTGREVIRIDNVISDGISLYDENGEFLFTYGLPSTDGSVGNSAWLAGPWNQGFLVSDCDKNGSHETIFYRKDGTIQWIHSSGMILRSFDCSMLSWKNVDSEGVITDSDLNVVIDEQEWRKLNSNIEIKGSMMKLVSENPNTGEYLIETSDEPIHYWYYKCDSEWRILEEYPDSQIYLEKKETTVEPWYWDVDKDGVLSISNIWTGISTDWQQDVILDGKEYDLAYGMEIKSTDSVILARYEGEPGRSAAVLGSMDGYKEIIQSQTRMGFGLTESSENLTEAYLVDQNTLYKTIYWFDAKGQYLGTNEKPVIFCSDKMTCKDEGSRIEIYDQTGRLLLVIEK